MYRNIQYDHVDVWHYCMVMTILEHFINCAYHDDHVTYQDTFPHIDHIGSVYWVLVPVQ